MCGHGRAVGMPEACHHHVLDGAGFAVRELHLDLLTPRDRFRSGDRWLGHIRRQGYRAGLPRLRLDGLTVPLRIAEMVVCLHEVVNREVVLAVIEPRTAPDDLLELDHRVDWPHQDDVADVTGVHSG